MANERRYKDTLFRLIFGKDKEALLNLYNALNHTDYDNPNELEINTIEGAIYMGMRNDVSFILSDVLNLYEHQASINPNMPIRFLRYLSDIYKEIVKDENIYSSKLIPLPTPKFVVFYNGIIVQKERYEYRLSDAYIQKFEDYQLELKVDVYNINPKNNEELKRACKLLGEYTLFVEAVRERIKERKEIKQALKEVIEECIIKDILREFLNAHKSEVLDMDWLYEYDEERHMKMEREEWHAIGKEEGIKEGINSIVVKALKKGNNAKSVAEFIDIPLETVLEIEKEIFKKTKQS